MSAVMAVNVEPAGELLNSLRQMGLRVHLGEDDGIKVSPRDRVTLEMRSRIQALRDGLRVHLESERKAARQLERRVDEMGQRWGYSVDELQEAQQAAQRDPEGWAAACDADEISARRARRAGYGFPV